MRKRISSRWPPLRRNPRPRYPTDITRQRRKSGKNVKLDKWTPRRSKRGNKVQNTTTIHSDAWVASILPQNCLLFSLPLEVKQQIYGYLFDQIIEPRICSYSFIDYGRPYITARSTELRSGPSFTNYIVTRNVSQITTLAKSLSLVSRQVYLDTRYCLYRHTMFRFENLYYLKTYFSHISTFKVDMLRNIQIWLDFGRGNNEIPRPLLKRLSALPSLRLLEFTITVTPMYVGGLPQLDATVNTLEKADWSLFKQSALRTLRFQFDARWGASRSFLYEIDWKSQVWKGFVGGVQRESGANVPAVRITECDYEERAPSGDAGNRGSWHSNGELVA